MTCYFISDCHLHAQAQVANDKFANLLAQLKPSDCLYILGDFFDVWIGDDQQSAHANSIRSQLTEAVKKGIDIFIMQGNRDFLLAQSFCQQTGCQLLSDPCLINLYGTPTLLTHGDLLCTDDIRYQRFRHLTHSPIVQSLYLALPLAWRQAIARRVQSTTQHTRVDADATSSTIQAYCQRFNTTQLIHGHTHKPSIEHCFTSAGKLTRYVLSDWHRQGHYLKASAQGAFESCFF